MGRENNKTVKEGIKKLRREIKNQKENQKRKINQLRRSKRGVG